MRRRRPERRQILPDPVYNDLQIAKFVNYLMKRGKKGVAEKIFYNALDKIKQKTKSDGVKIFENAIEHEKSLMLAKKDPLTGALNRREGVKLINILLKRAEFNGTNVSQESHPFK